MPRANTDRFGRRGFSVSGPNQWNKLPPDIRKVSDKPEQFARALKIFFYFQTALLYWLTDLKDLAWALRRFISKYCNQRVCVCMAVCLFVCLFVYPLICVKKHTWEFHGIFCTCYLWTWLGPPLTAMRYFMYFRFCGWRHVLHNAINGPESKTTLCFVQFARWRHRGEVFRLCLHLVTVLYWNCTCMFCDQFRTQHRPTFKLGYLKTTPSFLLGSRRRKSFITASLLATQSV